MNFREGQFPSNLHLDPSINLTKNSIAIYSQRKIEVEEIGKSEIAVRDRDRRRARGVAGVRRRPFILVRIDAETLVVVSPCDKELLEVRDTVQLAVI